jgi:O-antigen/teichoic acid export membrane protein
LSGRRSLDRATGRSPLPEGTLSVGAGLVISGISAYLFLSIANSQLGKENFAPVSQLWFATFILAPGFFLPVEQELGRALAHRRALGEGGLPVVRKAAVLALGLVGIISAFILIFSQFLVRELFHGEWSLLFALLLAFIAYGMAHFTRGLCSGSGRFGPYGLVMGAEGLLRVAFCLVIAAVGVTAIGPWGFLVGIPPLIAVGITLRKERGFKLTEGPAAQWSEITPNLGWLLAGSAMAAALVNAGPIAANLLAEPDQKELVSSFAYGVLIARVPLFLFQAVQAALLPKLARLAAIGQLTEFKVGFRKLMIVVVVVGSIGTIGAFLFGPFAVKVFFDADLSRRTLTLLAISSALYMVAVAMAQALIALHGHAKVAIGWLVGMTAFVVVTAVAGDDLLLRVEAGLVAGSLFAVAAFGVMLHAELRRKDLVMNSEDLFTAIYDMPIET